MDQIILEKSNAVLFKAIRKSHRLIDPVRFQTLLSILHSLFSGTACPHYLILFTEKQKIINIMIHLLPLFLQNHNTSVQVQLLHLLGQLTYILDMISPERMALCITDLCNLLETCALILLQNENENEIVVHCFHQSWQNEDHKSGTSSLPKIALRSNASTIQLMKWIMKWMIQMLVQKPTLMQQMSSKGTISALLILVLNHPLFEIHGPTIVQSTLTFIHVMITHVDVTLSDKASLLKGLLQYCASPQCCRDFTHLDICFISLQKTYDLDKILSRVPPHTVGNLLLALIVQSNGTYAMKAFGGQALRVFCTIFPQRTNELCTQLWKHTSHRNVHGILLHLLKSDMESEKRQGYSLLTDESMSPSHKRSRVESSSGSQSVQNRVHALSFSTPIEMLSETFLISFRIANSMDAGKANAALMKSAQGFSEWFSQEGQCSTHLSPLLDLLIVALFYLEDDIVQVHDLFQSLVTIFTTLDVHSWISSLPLVDDVGIAPESNDRESQMNWIYERNLLFRCLFVFSRMTSFMESSCNESLCAKVWKSALHHDKEPAKTTAVQFIPTYIQNSTRTGSSEESSLVVLQILETVKLQLTNATVPSLLLATSLYESIQLYATAVECIPNTIVDAVCSYTNALLESSPEMDAILVKTMLVCLVHSHVDNLHLLDTFTYKQRNFTTVWPVFSTNMALWTYVCESPLIENVVLQLITLLQTKEVVLTGGFIFEPILVTLGTVACALDRENHVDLFFSAMFELVRNWRCTGGRGSSSFDQMARVLQYHRTSWKELCIDFPELVYPQLVKLLVHDHLEMEEMDLRLESLFDNKVNVRVFLKCCTKHVLPDLVLEQNEKKMKCMAQILYARCDASQDKENTSNSMEDTGALQMEQMVLDHIPYIAKAMLMTRVENLQVVSKFLLRFLPPNTTLKDVVQYQPLHLLHILAWDLSGPRKSAAERAFLEMAPYLRQDLNEETCVVDGVIPRSHFLGLMTMLGRKLTTIPHRLPHRRRALLCIHQVLRLFGKTGLDYYVPKIMATLNVALRDDELRTIACTAWDTFVRQLSMSTLSSNIGAIVASLLYCIPKDIVVADSEARRKAISVLKFLFLEKYEELKHVFSKVSFLPDHDDLRPIRAAIDKSLSGTNVDLVDQLMEVTKVLRHWSVDVREMTLSHLLQLLHDKSTVLQSLIAGTSIPTIVPLLIRDILKLCCTESKRSVQLLAAECLGALGAVDPCKLPLDIFYTSPSLASSASLPSRNELSLRELAFRLIEDHLIPGLRSAPENTDSVAFAIQELLKFLSSLDPSFKKTNERGRKLPDWIRRRLEKNNVVDIVEPYWSTNYGTEGIVQTPERGKSFYDSSTSYEKWLISWCKYLISLTVSVQRVIFTAVRTALTTVPTIGRFLLPYLIQNALRSGRSNVHGHSNAHGAIKKEMISVLQDHGSLEANDEGNLWTGEDCTNSHHHQCAQTIFSTLDELSEWISKSEMQSRADRTTTGEIIVDPEKEYLEEFLKDVPFRTLAEAAFSINAYARSLQYFEIYLRQHGAVPMTTPPLRGSANSVHVLNISKRDTSFLQRIYSCTGEPDSLGGLAVCRYRTEAAESAGNTAYPMNHLSLDDRIVLHEHVSQWDDALHCYEQILQDLNVESNDDYHSSASISDGIGNYYAGYVKCHVTLGRLEAASKLVDGILFKYPKVLPAVYSQALQCAWRLSRWDSLESLLSNDVGVRLDDPDVYLSRALLSLHQKKREGLYENLRRARFALIGPLAAASVESYQRVYPILHRLHVLHEIECGYRVIEASCNDPSTPASIIWDRECPWEDRLMNTSHEMTLREPLLAVRRAVLQELGAIPKVAESWLQVAKMARVSGCSQAAANAVLHAQALRSPNAMLENAKILHSQGQIHEALQLLEPLPLNVRQLKPSDNPAADALRAKTLLLTTHWIQNSQQKQGTDIIERYQTVIQLNAKWGKGYFYLARYCEYLLKTTRKEQHGVHNNSHVIAKIDERAHVYLIMVLQNYIKALQFGTKYLFQALPRFLTLWFEYGELLHDNTSHGKNVAMSKLSNEHPKKRLMDDITEVVTNAINVLPTYEWISVLSQVTSRICHPNPFVVDGVKSITVRVLSKYPVRTMWLVLGLSRSLNQQRRQRAQGIVTKAQKELANRSGLDEAAKGIAEGIKLFDELIALAAADTKGQRRVSMKLSRIRTHILVPRADLLLAHMPQSGKAESDCTYDPFPNTAIYIKGFADKADVMQSKERPKKVKMLGSDGISYSFLCKREQHGDLRKDARMMEITTMVNKLLSRSAEGRKRNLRVRGYAVVCLNEDSGLIEWVLNTTAYRQLVCQIYKTEKGFLQPVRLTREIKEGFLQMQAKYADNLPAMATYYRARVLSLPVFVPRFHQWFLNTFSDPTAWVESRLAFGRSAAVWSMLGHVVGLGDRHGENLLIDCSNGECVHVDFDCLFDKGLKLSRPEIVPFRLTPNMIDAMGLTGYEGVFRRVSEVTMELLRQNKDTLMSVLESFIHDPIVEWGRSGKTQKNTTSTKTGTVHSNAGNTEAKIILVRIQLLRLCYLKYLLFIIEKH